MFLYREVKEGPGQMEFTVVSYTSVCEFNPVIIKTKTIEFSSTLVKKSYEILYFHHNTLLSPVDPSYA